MLLPSQAVAEKEKGEGGGLGRHFSVQRGEKRSRGGGVRRYIHVEEGRWGPGCEVRGGRPATACEQRMRQRSGGARTGEGGS
jgi:hypothetical protein